MIELHTANTSNGQRAAIILAECGIPHRVHKYDLFKGEHRKSPDFMAIAPAGAIPVIVDPEGPDGKPLVLSQSCAILLYVAEKAGRFLPDDPVRRAATFQWLMQAATDVSSNSGYFFFNAALLPDKSEANAKWTQDRILKVFGDCDRRLGQRDYLADEVSVADFALYPVYAVRRKMVDDAGNLPHLTRWAERMSAREGVRKGMAAAE